MSPRDLAADLRTADQAVADAVITTERPLIYDPGDEIT